MDFHGMNRRNLQILCKKHGIPANLKNIEMANRLASLFQKEDEETVTETKISPEEDYVEADDGIEEEEENLVVSRKGKKVRFSPESDNQVFEFTRSVKRNVRRIRRKHGKALEEDGRSVELKRSKRSVSKGITVDGSSGDVSNSVSGIVEAEKVHSNSVKVTRRSKRIGSKGSDQEEGKETDLIAQEQFGDEDIQNGRRSTRLAARTEKSCVEGGASEAVALLPAAKRSKRAGSGGSSQEEGKDTDLIAQEQFGARDVKDGRRSTKMAGKIEKSYEEGGTSKSVALLPTAKRSKRIGSGGSTQEEAKDTDLNAPELFEDRDVQGGRRSTRLAAKTEQSFEEGGTSKSVTLLPAAKRSKRVVNFANKEDEKETGEEQHRKGDDCKVEMVRRRSMRFVNDVEAQGNTQDRRKSVRLKASVANPLMGQAKNDLVKASRVVKGTLVESLKRVTRNMKRERSTETGVDGGTASSQSNLKPTKTMDVFAHFEQEEACGADVKAGGSSKKSKSMNQECIKDKPQEILIIEDSSASSETKAAESVEKVFVSTLDKSNGSSQRSNTRELNCESVEEECEEKLERDAVMPVIEEDKEPTCHILVKDVASTVIVEESTKTKDEALIYAPESELKEHSSIAKLSNVEEILENSTECCKEIHSSEAEDDGKCSLEKDVRAENLHGNASECNTENSSAEEEMEISKVGGMSAGDYVNLTPEKLSGQYAQLKPEEAERHNVGDRSSSQKMKKIVGQELVKDKPQGMAEVSPSTSETKATEPVLISENVLDSKRKVSSVTSAVRKSHELNSELLEEKREEKHEQATILLVGTKKDKGEASPLSEFLIERSEVKPSPRNCSTVCSLSVETTLSPASVQLAMSNPEADLGLPTGNDIVSTVITEEDKITKEETLISTPTSVATLTKVEAILGNSDAKGFLEKDVQAENLHVKFSERNTENSNAEEEMEISKVGCTSVNLTPEKLLDGYTQLVPEEAGEPNVKTVSSEFVKENPQGMVEDSEPIMVSENVLDSTSKVSVDISLVRNTQELNSELMEAEREEKQEEDIVLMAATKKDEEEASSLSELFMQTTPPPSSVQIAVGNPESELSVPTGHILVKDIVSAVIAKEDNKTEEVPKSVQSFVAKFAETDAVLKNSAECWNESLSSKDNDGGSLEKEKQSAKRHGNFSEYNAENSRAEEQADDIGKVGRISDGHCVDRETLDEVKDESLMKSAQTISSQRGCRLNALELSGSLSTDFASHSHKEGNVSECLEEEEMKALSQPTPINKAASNVLDRSSLFTTPERNFMLMEQLSESGKISAADIVTHHSDEAVESVVFTTPEKVLLLGDSGLDEAEKEEEHTTTDFPDDLNTTQNEAFNEKEKVVVELHDESNIAASPLRQSSVGDFKEESTERNEEIRTSELHCESGTCTGPDKHAALLNSVSDGAETVGENKAMKFYEESVGFTGLEERRELFGYSGHDKAREGEVTKAAQFYEEVGLSSEMHKDLPLADPELGERGLLEINNADKSGSLEGQLLYGDSEQKTAVKSAEKEAAQFHDESAVLNILERHPFLEESELEEATKSEESKALELQADCDNFTGANVSATSHDMYDVLTTSESHTLMGDFEPDEEENKDVELLGESNISTNEESGQDEMIKHSTAANCEESFVFISPERRHHLGNSERKEVEFKDESAIFTRLEARLLLGESGQDRLGNGESGSTQFQSHHASSPKVILKDNSVIRESHVAAPDFRENTITASKVSHSHEFSAAKETSGAGFKASQAENVVGLDVMQGTSKQSRENSPHVDSVNHFDFDTMGVDTIMDAERNVSFSSYVLALPAKGNSQTTGDISNSLEVARTCSLVSDSEESGPSADIQNQIHDATDELIDAKVPKNTQNDSEAIGLPAEGDSETIGKISSQLEFTETCYSSMVSLEVTETCYSSMVSEKSTPFMDVQDHINDALEEVLAVTDNKKADELIEAKVTENVYSSDGSDVSGKTCFLAGTEDEHLGYDSEATYTAFEEDISLAPDQYTLQKNRNEEAADGEMLKREATPPSPEETLNESSDNIGESGTSSEKQVRREPILIYRTQMKPTRHDMKENAPNSKIVDNLNVTAPRTSKRQPLQDLRKN